MPPGKQLGAFDFKAADGLSQVQAQQLIQSRDWVKRGENILLFGASGIGKTHLACAIVYGLIDAGIRVKFMPAIELVQTLQRAKAEMMLTDAVTRLDKFGVLIVDDLGYVRMAEQESSVLFELITHRYERHSLIIKSNQSFEGWDQLFVGTVMTVAAFDRLVHHATIFLCEGDSYGRKQSAEKQAS